MGLGLGLGLGFGFGFGFGLVCGGDLGGSEYLPPLARFLDRRAHLP